MNTEKEMYEIYIDRKKTISFENYEEAVEYAEKYPLGSNVEIKKTMNTPTQLEDITELQAAKERILELEKALKYAVGFFHVVDQSELRNHCLGVLGNEQSPTFASKSAVEAKVKAFWISIEDEKPMAYKIGNWDGHLSDDVLVEDENGKKHLAHLNTGFLDGSKFEDWYDVNSTFDIKTKIVCWMKIPDFGETFPEKFAQSVEDFKREVVEDLETTESNSHDPSYYNGYDDGIKRAIEIITNHK